MDRISVQEIKLAKHCIAYAGKLGAQQCRVSLSKSISDTYAMLGDAHGTTLDKVTHSADRSIYINLFVDGRYGTYSTNRIERGSLEQFITRAVGATRLLCTDPLRKLPDMELCVKGAETGFETGLYDAAYEKMTPAGRRALAQEAASLAQRCGEGWKIASIEVEYSDNIDDNYLIDSRGVEGRHTETSFSASSEVTVEDARGNKYSSFWWEASPFLSDFAANGKDVSETACRMAMAQFSPQKARGGVKNMVVDRTAASRLVAPLVNALQGYSIQQHCSFLEDSQGRKIFSEALTLKDMPHAFGSTGARLFDTEGVATMDRVIIDKGVVSTYFIDSYIAGKTGLPQTADGTSLVMLEPTEKAPADEVCSIPVERTGAVLPCAPLGLMRRMKKGIYVTGFNGGNCNSATGDFSYGIQGFSFSTEGGKLVVGAPVREMVITGNMTGLWNSLEAAGNDARSCSRWQIPSLAFSGVHFSA